MFISQNRCYLFDFMYFLNGIDYLFLANTMSNAPKFDEVQSVILRLKTGLSFFFTETWLRDTISDNLINIPGVDH